MTHLGRDFSSFQGNLTAADVAGIDFAYIKATQGDGYQNPDAVQQASMCRSRGVQVGFYHYFDPAAAVEDQVHNLTRFVSALGGTKLPIALDTEQRGNDAWPALASQMMNFVVAVEGLRLWAPHPRSLLYVNLSYYESLPGFPWGRWVWLADPNAGAPHRPCLILQGAPRPVSATDSKSVDPDTFLGTEADWQEFVGGTATPAPQPTQYPEDDLQTTPVTFKTDPQGNAWIASPFPVGTVVSAVPVNIDPNTAHAYTNVPRFAGVTQDGQLVFEAGAPNAEFGFNIWATS